MEVKLAAAIGAFQKVDELAAKDTAEDPHRCEERASFSAGSAGKEPSGTGREPVRLRSPRSGHGGGASDSGPRCGAPPRGRFRRRGVWDWPPPPGASLPPPETGCRTRRACSEAPGDGFLRQGKDHVEVRDRQQLGLPCLQPGGTGCRLALRAVAVAAGVVLDPLVPTFVAALHMPAQCRGPATDDCGQDLTLFGPQRVTVLGDEAGLAIAEHVGDFQIVAHQATSSCGGGVVPFVSFAALGASSRSIMLGASRNSSNEMCV